MKNPFDALADQVFEPEPGLPVYQERSPGSPVATEPHLSAGEARRAAIERGARTAAKAAAQRESTAPRQRGRIRFRPLAGGWLSSLVRWIRR